MEDMEHSSYIQTNKPTAGNALSAEPVTIKISSDIAASLLVGMEAIPNMWAKNFNLMFEGGRGRAQFTNRHTGEVVTIVG